MFDVTPTVDAVVARPSFEELFADRYRPMVRLAFALVGDNGIAEELVQDAFARVHQHWSRVDAPLPYLRRAVVNACNNEHRRRRTRRLLTLGRLDAADADASARPAGNPSSTVEFLDTLRVLTPRQRTVVVLRFHEGLSEADIATAMGMRPGTVKSTLFRAVQALREQEQS